MWEDSWVMFATTELTNCCILPAGNKNTACRRISEIGDWSQKFGIFGKPYNCGERWNFCLADGSFRSVSSVFSTLVIFSSAIAADRIFIEVSVRNTLMAIYYSLVQFLVCLLLFIILYESSNWSPPPVLARYELGTCLIAITKFRLLEVLAWMCFLNFFRFWKFWLVHTCIL